MGGYVLMFARLLAVVILVAGLSLVASVSQAQDAGDYVGAWAASPQPPYEEGISQDGFSDQTVRNIVRANASGTGLRVRLSNAFGEQPLTIGAASVARHAGGASTVAGTDLALTFGGEPSVTIPAGKDVYSDPVAFEVAAGEDLAVSLYVEGASGPTTWHQLAQQTSYVSNPGDHTADAAGTSFSNGLSHFFFLTAVDVSGSAAPGAVVALGDSITDGYGSAFGADGRYPDYLARRLRAMPQAPAVLNAGISGNRILRDSPEFGVKALDRLDRDVLSQSGVTDIILLEGINDIQQTPHVFDAERITDGMQEIIDRAHEEGIEVHGATLLPFERCIFPECYSQRQEETRLAVNDFVRNSGEFDGVVDFDAALRDPDDPARLLPEYDSGDHLHPNDAGYRVMAETVDLALLEDGQTATEVPDTGGISPAVVVLPSLVVLATVALGFRRLLAS